MLPVLISSVILLALATLTALWFYAARISQPPRQVACQTPLGLKLDAERVEFSARDGIRLRGWWITARQARGTIVFSHGYSGDCSPDLEYAEWLQRAGYNLLYFDHRAHGASEGRITTLGILETRDLLGAIDFLKARGIERVGVMGFSMGGSVVLQTAALTDAIQCVVADCTFASLQTLFTHLASFIHLPRLIAPVAASIMVTCMSIQTRCNLFAHSPVRSIGQIAPRPVLLIQAGADELIPASETEHLYAAAGSPKELWLVDGANHRAVDKAVREEYERRITAFFDRYLGSPRIIEAADRFAENARSEPASAARVAAD